MNTLKSFQPETWETVSRNLLTKMIAEFMYEDIIHPEMEKADGENQRCRLELKSGVTYTFEVKKRLFDSYRVHGDTIYRQENGEVKPADQSDSIFAGHPKHHRHEFDDGGAFDSGIHPHPGGGCIYP
jgi:siderophore synthetase component